VILELGSSHRFDITHRALVMGILNRTPDSFYDQGAYFGFDDFLRKAETLVAEGADFLDVGGVKAGPGAEVTVAEELDRVVPAIAALRARFDVPISVDTFRAAVVTEAFTAGAQVGNDISGFADPGYLPAAAAHGASVVATHIRLAPRIPDPRPVYGDVRRDVGEFLRSRAAMARAAGIPTERIMVEQALPRHAHRGGGRRSPRRHVGRTRPRHRARLPCAAGPRRPRRPAGGRRDGRDPPAGRAMSEASVHLLIGDDPTVLGDAVHTVVHEALGGADRDLALVQLTEEDLRVEDHWEIAPLVDAAQTPPFLTDHRVVVGRHLGRFTKGEDLAPLLGYLADPLPSTRLVLVWERGQNPRQDRHGAPPKKLSEAVGAIGGTVIDTAIPGGKAADAWLEQRMANASVKLDRGARQLVHDRLGEDRSRVLGLLATLESTYGARTTVTADEIEPFLGDAGSVPPWELTDAIDRGGWPACSERGSAIRCSCSPRCTPTTGACCASTAKPRWTRRRRRRCSASGARPSRRRRRSPRRNASDRRSCTRPSAFWPTRTWRCGARWPGHRSS
jgi:hypothetical protein